MTTRLSFPHILLWTAIGVFLTIATNFVAVAAIAWPWQWGNNGIVAHSLFITAQIGAVLLVGCVGGKYAGLFAQIAYICLGLIGWQIFHDGGGASYWHKPTFGYILGFMPAAWCCGYLAFLRLPRLERLLMSCIAGLLAIHTFGILYIIFLQLAKASDRVNFNWLDAILNYSVYPLPSQLLLACAVAVIAACWRKIMLY
jgi:biotin transport system substrate-specific component